MLFADMADYTAHSEKLGEETIFKIMRRVLGVMTEAVRDHHGIVQDYAGDGILAVFGAPIASESAPLRACQAALVMQQRMAPLGPAIEAEFDMRPQLRIGLNSGRIVLGAVGTGDQGERRVIGDTVNLASRLQALAERGAIVMSGATQALVAPYVRSAFLGNHEIKGKAQRVPVWRLDAVRDDVTRFDAAVSRGLTRIVGRGRELDILESCWRRARDGEIHFVNVSGEPGIGKSRLVHELREKVEGDGQPVLRGHCSSERGTTAFHPFIEVVRHANDIGLAEDAAAVSEKLRLGLDRLGLEPEQHLPFLANLLGVSPGPHATKLDPNSIGPRIHESLNSMLRENCRRSPTVLFIEDLHSIDGGSETFLSRLFDSHDSIPLLVICTFRPEYRPPWAERSYATDLPLSALSKMNSIDLIKSRLDVETVPDSLASLLANKSEGNPLFAEELMSDLVETGRLRVADGQVEFESENIDSTLPSTIENLIMQRVDRLDEGPRETLRVASVVGRRFSPDLVGTVAGLNGQAAEYLEVLEDKDLVFADTARADGSYQIKHALILDAVYNNLLSDRRQVLHLAVAEAIESAHPVPPEDLVDTLAHHYSCTDRASKAAHYLHVAGIRNLQFYVLDEAERQLRDAAALCEACPGIVDARLTIDIGLELARTCWHKAELAAAVIAIEPYLSKAETLGDKARQARCMSTYGMAQVLAGQPGLGKPVLEQAWDLATEVGDDSALALAALGLGWHSFFYIPQDPEETDRLRDLVEQTASIAEDLGDTVLTIDALSLLAISTFMKGDPRISHQYVDRLFAFGRRRDSSTAFHSGLLLLALIDLLQNAPKDALTKVDEALALTLIPVVRDGLLVTKAVAFTLADQEEDAANLIEELQPRLVQTQHAAALLALGPIPGIVEILNGRFGKGIRSIEAFQKWLFDVKASIDVHAYSHLLLGEVYMNMVSRAKRPTRSVILRNLWFLLRTLPFAAAKAKRHLSIALRRAEEADHTGRVAWVQMDLGLLAKAKKNYGEARSHLEQAVTLAETIEAYSIAERSRAALADLY